ncbi:MAG TPA: apolipoprotein N-acyltransferase [Gemmataceae bacterium]|nr:apolipoprotein N-acyltransferase [Gemmataceae bacterium]
MFDPSKPRSRVFLPAVLSGLLLYACYFPLNFGFLGWVALVPLLSLVRANARSRRIYFAAFVGGLFCYVPAIQWIRVAHPAMYASWLILAVYCSLGQTFAIFFVRRLDRVGVPLWLGAPIAWMSVEYFRSHFPSGFTWLEPLGLHNPIGFGWYMLGHTQHEFIPLIQLADLTGVYGLTALVAMANGLIYQFATNFDAWRNWVRMPGGPLPLTPRARCVVGGLILGAVAYGQIQLATHAPFSDGPQVALIQGNIPQDMKNTAGRSMEEHFAKLAAEAVRPADGRMPDLVVWPETSYVGGWFDVTNGVDPRALDPGPRAGYFNSRVVVPEDLARYYESDDLRDPKLTTLLGLTSFEWDAADGKPWRYNSALLLDPSGRPAGRYDKVHLVPFGEYVLFGETLPFMRMFTPYDQDYSCKPGTRWTRFPLPVGDRTYHFACIICYEDSDPTLARRYVRPGAEGVDFFVNISNDGWFDGTEEHEQHLAVCRFRAVETRRSVVRAVNMGVSAIINPDGRVTALPGPDWRSSKKVEGVVRGEVPIDTRGTVYTRFGDWLPVLGWFVLVAGFVRGWRTRKA